MKNIHSSDHVIISIGLPVDFYGPIFGAISPRYPIKIQNSFIDLDAVWYESVSLDPIYHETSDDAES